MDGKTRKMGRNEQEWISICRKEAMKVTREPVAETQKGYK